MGWLLKFSGSPVANPGAADQIACRAFDKRTAAFAN
jgi:hypothetical protein